jgi:hypothetical protein
LPSSAKPQLDGLVLFLVNPATHPTHLGKFIFQHFSVNINQVSSQELEDDLNGMTNGRQPQFILKMEDNLNLF